MFKPSEYINEICPGCHPQSYELSLAKYTGQKNIEETSNADESYIEYLYECCQCGTKVWVDESWMKRHAVESTSVEVLHQRQLYISRKGRELDAITDAHKYTRRLSRIMWYHKLLTEIEVVAIRKILKGDG